MSDRKHPGDFGGYDYSYDHEYDNPEPHRGVSPGKAPITARLAARPQTNIVFRVANAASAAALAGAFGSRDDNGVAESADAAVSRASASSGQSLPADVRERFESSLGADLGSVRIHTGAESAQAAEAVGARAYTVGTDIHFAEGEYKPVDPFGLHLLAHEVAHTVQQSGGAPRRQNKLAVSSPGDAAETEADRAADAMVRGAPATIASASPSIARKPNKGKPTGASQLISENDKAFMRSQSAIVAKAGKDISGLADGVKKFVGQAEGIFDSMQEQFEATKKLYDQAVEEVNTVLRMGAKTQAGREAVVSTLIDAAMAPISAKVGELVQSQFKAGNQAVKDALESFPDDLALPGATTGSLMPDLDSGIADTGTGKLKGSVEGKIKGGAKEAATGDSGTGSSVSGGADKGAFWQSIAGHRKKISSVATLAASAAKAAGPIGQVQGAIDSVVASGRSRPDYSMDQMAADAQALAAGAQKFRAGGKKVAGMGKSLGVALTMMQAAAPDKKEIQKRLVMDFLAKYKSNVDLITEHDVQVWMKNREFFQSLGIDIEELDSWFNADEEDVTRAIARAQQMVTAKAGTSMVVKGNRPHISEVDLPGIGYLPARLDAGDVGWVSAVRAVVVGAEAARQPKPKDIAGVTAAIDVRAKHLIKNGFVRVLLKSYEDLEAKEEEGEE